MTAADRETDTLRLRDLAKDNGLKFKPVGEAYLFDDYTFTARSLGQALAFAEGSIRPGEEWMIAARKPDPAGYIGFTFMDTANDEFVALGGAAWMTAA